MGRRTFVAAAAATSPLTAPQASIAPDPAIQAVRGVEQRFNALGKSPEVVAVLSMPVPSVTAFGVRHTSRDELDA